MDCSKTVISPQPERLAGEHKHKRRLHTREQSESESGERNAEQRNGERNRSEHLKGVWGAGEPRLTTLDEQAKLTSELTWANSEHTAE